MDNDYPTFTELDERTVPNEFGKALCAKWGIDPSKVTSIEITITPYEIYARIDVVGDEGTLCEVLQLTVTSRHIVKAGSRG